MGGGPSIPTASTPGYTSYPALYGPDVACYCLAQWLNAFRRLLKAKGLTDITVWQLCGANAKSAGTHLPGGAVDFSGVSRTKALLAREGGGVALPRDWAGNRHTHTPLIGCAHNSGSRYQIDAVVKYRRDGLGSDGMAGPDPLPKPSKWRTWREGVEWFEAETKKLQPKTPTVTVPEEDIMATTTELRDLIRKELRDYDYLREVARFVLTGYAFDHDGNPDTPEAVLAYAERATLQEATLSDADVERIASAMAALLPKA